LGYLLPSISAGIDARYNLGLTNIPAQEEAGQTLKNSVFQVGVFYIFGSK
jgi:hypothetical protein